MIASYFSFDALYLANPTDSNGLHICEIKDIRRGYCGCTPGEQIVLATR